MANLERPELLRLSEQIPTARVMGTRAALCGWRNAVSACAWSDPLIRSNTKTVVVIGNGMVGH
ncbi:MAG TPA: hypothetical protein VFI31_23320, partial [Pirellulales bacterium]|nr:hypothetical protein [Pirellulales bacterium]